MPLYGHVFRLQPDGSLFPYEFHVADQVLRKNARSDIFKELADFLRSNRLSDLLALQFLNHGIGFRTRKGSISIFIAKGRTGFQRAWTFPLRGLSKLSTSSSRTEDLLLD